MTEHRNVTLESAVADLRRENEAHALYHARYPAAHDCGFDSCKDDLDAVPPAAPPEPSSFEIHCKRAYALGAFLSVAKMSDSEIRLLGTDYVIEAVRRIRGEWIETMGAYGYDEHGGRPAGAR